MAQRRYEALQNDPSIARFVMEGVTTGSQLGIGSYGSVEEVHWRIRMAEFYHFSSIVVI